MRFPKRCRRVRIARRLHRKVVGGSNHLKIGILLLKAIAPVRDGADQ
jgi:hypothetical protein